jgi:hypothetical protein
MNVVEPPLLVRYTPDQPALEKCKELGRKVAEKLSINRLQIHLDMGRRQVCLKTRF